MISGNAPRRLVVKCRRRNKRPQWKGLKIPKRRLNDILIISAVLDSGQIIPISILSSKFSITLSSSSLCASDINQSILVVSMKVLLAFTYGVCNKIPLYFSVMNFMVEFYDLRCPRSKGYHCMHQSRLFLCVEFSYATTVASHHCNRWECYWCHDIYIYRDKLNKCRRVSNVDLSDHWRRERWFIVAARYFECSLEMQRRTLFGYNRSAVTVVEGRPSNTTWKQYLQRMGAPIVFDTLLLVLWLLFYVSMEWLKRRIVVLSSIENSSALILYQIIGLGLLAAVLAAIIK